MTGSEHWPSMFAPGRRVVIQGLQSAVELNGRQGVVLEPLAENLAKGRIRVYLDGKELAVRPEALVLATDVPDEMQESEEEEDFEEGSEEDEFEDDGICEESPEGACGIDAAPSPLQSSVFWCYGCFRELNASQANRCSKCRTAVFCSRECQRKCNKYHHVSCRAPEHQKVETLNGSAVLRHLQQQFHGGGPTSETASLLTRMRSLLIAAYTGKEKKSARRSLGHDPDDVGMELHTMARIFLPCEEELQSYYNYFWTAPGMPEFLLGTELSTSKKHVPGEFRGRDEWGHHPEDYDMDDGFGEGASMAGYQFAFFHFNFLARSIIMEGSRGMNMSDVNSCVAPLRKDAPYFKAAAHRLGILYLSSCRTCGDSLCAGPGAMLMLCAAEPELRRKFLNLGLGRAALHEVQTAASRRTALQLLESVPLSEWQQLPIQEAALLAGDLVECLQCGEEEEDSVRAAQKVLNALLRKQTMGGLSPSDHAVEIMEHVLASGLRCEAETRAFFHFLLSKRQGAERETFDASRDIKAWKVISSHRFSDEGKKTYLQHMWEVMGTQERRDWNFLFKAGTDDARMRS